MDPGQAGCGAGAGSRAGAGVGRRADVRPDGMLFAADPQAATIYALDLGEQAAGGKAGAADVAAIDQKIAALLGTEVAAIAVNDLVIHPKTKNAYLSVMRGTGADAKPALLRVDGDGKISRRRARPA